MASRWKAEGKPLQAADDEVLNLASGELLAGKARCVTVRLAALTFWGRGDA